MTTLALTICLRSSGNNRSFRPISDSMSVRILTRSLGEIAGLYRWYPLTYCSSCCRRISGEPQAMFQALQAASRRFCFSSAVLPTPMKAAAISRIILDIFRLDSGAEFILVLPHCSSQPRPHLLLRLSRRGPTRWLRMSSSSSAIQARSEEESSPQLSVFTSRPTNTKLPVRLSRIKNRNG